MITLKNISVSFDERLVLDKFSFAFPKKGVVLITGSSGIGKTTLTRVILGLTTPNSGEVDTGGAEISVVFQEDRLVPSLTALKNVELVSNRASAKERLSQMGL
ncbi:MAG: ATP-binding cassette domain-containing protein, partial [Clostridia bacterium]|nr:ATP-binding cassette domain-containing protein [Clostridia bacterium]